MTLSAEAPGGRTRNCFDLHAGHVLVQSRRTAPSYGEFSDRRPPPSRVRCWQVVPMLGVVPPHGNNCRVAAEESAPRRRGTESLARRRSVAPSKGSSDRRSVGDGASRVHAAAITRATLLLPLARFFLAWLLFAHDLSSSSHALSWRVSSLHIPAQPLLLSGAATISHSSSCSPFLLLVQGLPQRCFRRQGHAHIFKPIEPCFDVEEESRTSSSSCSASSRILSSSTLRSLSCQCEQFALLLDAEVEDEYLGSTP